MIRIAAILVALLIAYLVLVNAASGAGGHTPAQRDREIATLQRKVKRLECAVSLLQHDGVLVTNQGTIRGACRP